MTMHIRAATSRHKVLLLILCVALVHGLAYVFVVPPWQHYDEPSHFEYSWLIADRLSLPKPGDYDPKMRRATMRSMAAHGFYSSTQPGSVPDVDALRDDELSLIISQLDHQPAYYLISAIPLLFLRSADITLQLYANRLTSLALFFLSIAIAYLTVAEITHPGSPLRWAVPLSMALVPSFVDSMTSVNNDAGANMAFAAFLWCSVVCVARGLSLLRLFLLFATAALCWFTKRTAAGAVALVPLVLLFAIVRSKGRRMAWIAAGVATLLGVVAVFAWGDAAYWYRGTQQEIPTRSTSLGRNIELGDQAFMLEGDSTNPRPSILQLIGQAGLLRGKTVTVGAWLWASRPITVNLPVLHVLDGSQQFIHEASIKTSPTFHAFTATVPTDLARMWITLTPFSTPSTEPVQVFYDGVVLVEGNMSLDIAPSFYSAIANTGEWAGRPFMNLIRNASAEQAWPYMRPLWTSLPPFNRTREFVPYNLWASLLDREGAGWYFRDALANTHQTFWAVFGWGQVRLTDGWYDAFAIITIAAIVGAVVAALRLRKTLDWTIAGILLINVGLILALTTARGIHSLLYSIFIPGARYAYPVMWPLLLILAAGWREIGIGVGSVISDAGLTRRFQTAALGLFIALCALLDVAALYRIVTFYAHR